MMQLLSFKEAAERAHISVRTLRQQIAEGRGPQVTRPASGKRPVLIREDVLDAWLKSRTSDGSLPG